MTEALTLRTPEEERSDRARRAVKAFRALLPTLNAYARTFTRNNSVRIEISSATPHTDGKTIFFRPPLELGDDVPHVRKVCNKRGDLGVMICPACALREAIMIQILHEISHIAEGSFAKVAESDLAYSVERSIAETQGPFAEAIRARIGAVPDIRRNTYLKVAGLISPYLYQITNAVEDARINERLFESRRGTRKMFETFMNQVLNGQLHEDTVTWKEQPLNAQIIAAVFSVMGGYSIEGGFAPEVEVAVTDPKLVELCERARHGKDMADSYYLAFPILARLRELGFCQAPEDPEPEPEPEENQDGEEDSNPEEGQESPQPDEEPDPDSDSEEEPPTSTEGDGEGQSTAGTGDEGEESEDSGDGDDQQDADSDDSSDQGGDADDDQDGASGGESDETQEGSGQSGDSDDAQEDSSESDDDGTGDAEDGQSSAAEAEQSDGGGDDPESSEGSDSGQPTESSDGGGVGDDEGTPEDVPEHSDFAGDDRGENADDRSSGDDGESDGGERPTQAEGEGSENLEGEGESDSTRQERPDSGTDEDAGSPSEQSKGSSDDDSSGGRESGLRDNPTETSEGGDSEDDSSSPVEASSPERPDDSGEELDDSVIDTGADDGEGGVPAFDPKDHNMGTPDEVNDLVQQILGHDEHDKPESVQLSPAEERALETAIMQAMYFETESRTVSGLRISRRDKPGSNSGIQSSFWENAWTMGKLMSDAQKKQLGMVGEFDPEEKVLGPALLKMRAVFADNRRGKNTRNLKSGKVNAKVLGKRAPVSDPRLFRHKTQPGKKDYAVVIGMDISGSNRGKSIMLLKRAVMAQANLLTRMGIDFSIIAHSGVYGNIEDESLGTWSDMNCFLDIYVVKDWNEPWAETQKQGLRDLVAYQANLDGHALEYLRKEVEKRQATDKIIMYYSDGKMPAENRNEELEILQREIRYCRRRDIKLLGVGIRTDSPTEHGLDTVQVDVDEDISKVIKHLEKHLAS